MVEDNPSYINGKGMGGVMEVASEVDGYKSNMGSKRHQPLSVSNDHPPPPLELQRHYS